MDGNYSVSLICVGTGQTDSKNALLFKTDTFGKLLWYGNT